MDKNVLRVTDIEHFHWSLSESDVPSKVALNGRLVSLAAAVELAIIDAHYRNNDSNPRKFNFAPHCTVYSAVKSANWPFAPKASSKRVNDMVVTVLPSADDTSWWNRQLQALRGELSSNLFPPRLAGALTGGVAERPARPGLLPGRRRQAAPGERIREKICHPSSLQLALNKFYLGDLR